MQETLARTVATAREGIPYWIFWFLLSLILLLLLFIFLRDKDLRRRMSLSLAGTKSRMMRKQWEVRLRRQRRRKTILCREIGRTIWAGRIAAERFGPIFARLGRLETQIAARHVVLQSLNDQIADVSGKIEDGRNGRPSGKERRRRHQLKDLSRKAKAERGRIRQRSREKTGEYERLGMLADEKRLEHPDLEGFYARIDQANRAILAVMDKIEKLK